MSGDTERNPSGGKTVRQRSNPPPPSSLHLPSVVFKAQLSLFCPLCRVMSLIAGRGLPVFGHLGGRRQRWVNYTGRARAGLAREGAAEEIKELMDGERAIVSVLTESK